MSEEVQRFQKECDKHFRLAQRFCLMTPASELQQERINDLYTLAVQAANMKKRASSVEDEDSANAVLSLEETIEAFASELRMWIILKDSPLTEDGADSAWNSLMDAQQHTSRAIRAHHIASGLNAMTSRLLLLEKALFPLQQFASVGMLVKQAKCSICEEEYGTCNHLKGLPYMGQFCVRISPYAGGRV